MTPIRPLFISETADRARGGRWPFMYHVQDRQGVALPVALLALVAVSIIVTSVLLSSATEVTLSVAHQDATRGLFRAEGAIEAYVAQNQLSLAGVTNQRYLPPGGSASDSVLVTVSVLGNVPNPDADFAGNPQFNDTTFSVAAAPLRGGRQVVALIDKVFRPIRMTVEGGLVTGDTINLKGNTTVSDGSDSQICADTVGGKAIQTAPGAIVNTDGNVKIIGEQEQTPVERTDLVQQMFGTDLKSLIARADIHFKRTTAVAGSTVFANDPITSDPAIKWPKVADKVTPQNTPYNWGCPADVFTSSTGATQCILDGDETHRPIVAIDAEGGTIDAQLSHGQGMLIIYNGNLKVAGNFTYKGVILVEGNFDIFATGGGSSAPKIEGAVIGVGTGSKVDNDLAGSPTIRYNRCAINLLRQQWEETKVFRRMGDRTYGWFEVVR